MNPFAQELQTTARAMVAKGKGILAMDESHATCNKRFKKFNIPETEEKRRDYRTLLITTPHLSDYISGAILYDETLHQKSPAGVPLIDLMRQAGLLIGIKVDTGAKDLPFHAPEKMTEGLDNLRERIANYYALGARFAKWRAVITIGENMPSPACLEANAHALARYAALCQEGGLVPIVEPEVLIEGTHTLQQCYRATSAALHSVFNHLHTQNVALNQIVLKPSMVIAGQSCTEPSSIEQVAETTVECLLNHVPASVVGVAFLSGGQTEAQASAHLNLMNTRYAAQCPWHLTFSYARAIQQPALACWRGDDANIEKAQQLLYWRAKCNGLASKGEYHPDLEKEIPA